MCYLLLAPLLRGSFLCGGRNHLNHFSLFHRSGNDLDIVIQGTGRLCQVELVLPKTVNVLAKIRRQCSYCLLIQFC